jgi:hypothetical protein
MPWVLGPALSMTASHGGHAKPDTIDAQTIAVLRRGGIGPPAYVSPAAKRATRDLRRRRRHLLHQRAERLAHLQTPNRQDHLAELGTKMADNAHRAGVAARFPAPAVQPSLQVDLALLDHSDHLLRDLARTVLHPATPHHPHMRSRRRTVPGIGASLSRVRRDAIPDIHRCPRLQACVAYGRLDPWAQASAGTRDGSAGTTSGHASLTWAFAGAAGLFLRGTPAGQPYLARVANTPRQGNTCTVVAHPLARALYDRRRRHTAFEMRPCLHA